MTFKKVIKPWALKKRTEKRERFDQQIKKKAFMASSFSADFEGLRATLEKGETKGRIGIELRVCLPEAGKNIRVKCIELSILLTRKTDRGKISTEFTSLQV